MIFILKLIFLIRSVIRSVRNIVIIDFIMHFSFLELKTDRVQYKGLSLLQGENKFIKLVYFSYGL